jgi:hypothetical protein
MAQKQKRPSLEELEQHKSTIAKERAKLELMKEERAGLRAVALSSFKQDKSKYFSAEELEALEAAPADDVIGMVLDKFEPYYAEVTDAKDAEIAEFEKELDSNHSNLEKMSEITAFFADNPDLDEEAFDDFLMNQLPNGTLREIQSLSVREGFDKAKALFDEANGATKDDKQELPADLDDVPGATADLENNEDGIEQDDSIANLYGQNK